MVKVTGQQVRRSQQRIGLRPHEVVELLPRHLPVSPHLCTSSPTLTHGPVIWREPAVGGSGAGLARSRRRAARARLRQTERVNRNVVKGILVAWQLPEFRAGLQHLIDLDEVTELLAALSVPDHDHEVERSALALLRSALDTAEIRRAVLSLVESDEVRQQLSAGLSEALADRPGLAEALRNALADPKVRSDLHVMLETPRARELIWEAAESGFDERRWALVRRAAVLLLRHRSARRLAWGLRRHGVLGELRRPVQST
jgi:hypothetical protein